MSSKSKRPKDSESKQSLDLEVEPMDQQVNNQQNNDVEMDVGLDNNLNGGLNLDMDVEQNGDANLDLADGTETNVSKKSKPKHGKKGVCVKCSKTKTVYQYFSMMCYACYAKYLKAKHEKEARQESKNLIICLKCNLLKKHSARKLCNSCYLTVKKDPEKLKQYPKTKGSSLFGQQGTCLKCNEQKTLYQCSMCRSCYEKDRKERRKAGAQKCGNCGKLKVLEQNGFCSDCNSDERIKEVANKQRLEKFLKSIEENELIASASLTVHVNLAVNAKCFEKFGKIKIDFSDFGDLSTLNSAGLDDNDKNSGSNKHLISNEDFVNRLKQYTSSKLKPLKKHNKSMDTKNASSIFDVEKEESAKSSPKAKQPSKIKAPSKSKKVILKECIDCKQMKPHYARDRCSACYRRFMRQKKKEDAEKVKVTEQVEENSGQNVNVQDDNLDQAEVPSDKPKMKRAKKQSSSDA